MKELTLNIKDDDLLTLKREWEQSFQKNNKDLDERQRQNEKYWKGKQRLLLDYVYGEQGKRLQDNRIFTSIETMLPIITRMHPEPVCLGNNTELSEDFARVLEDILYAQFDRQVSRLKLKQLVRFWFLYLLGVMKVGWDATKNDITSVVIRPQKLIMDLDCYIEGTEYTGYYVGELRKDSANTLMETFGNPDTGGNTENRAFLKDMVKGKMGTQVNYQEWWTNDMVFWTLRDRVLAKMRNPHFNYAETTKTTTDAYGLESAQTMPPKNHFVVPQMPYIFLSVFNLGTCPYDATSLIEQNMGQQDLLNKRLRQIDMNADKTNGTIVVYASSGLSKDQAAQAANAMESGDPILCPGPAGSVQHMAAPPLAGFVYEQAMDARNSIDNIMGTHSTTRGQYEPNQTATGKTLDKQSDETRLGFIAEYLEQVTDRLYNWWTQMIFVYYDYPTVAKFVGQERAIGFMQTLEDEIDNDVTVSVREGSMIPKDPISRSNEAVALFKAGVLDPLTLYERLNDPNPKKSVERLIAWQTGNFTALLDGENPVAMPPQVGMPGLPPQEGMQPPQMSPEDAAIQRLMAQQPQ